MGSRAHEDQSAVVGAHPERAVAAVCGGDWVGAGETGCGWRRRGVFGGSAAGRSEVRPPGVRSLGREASVRWLGREASVRELGRWRVTSMLERTNRQEPRACEKQLTSHGLRVWPFGDV